MKFPTLEELAKKVVVITYIPEEINIVALPKQPEVEHEKLKRAG